MPSAKDEVKPKSIDQNQAQTNGEEGCSSSATGSDSESGTSETSSSSGSAGQKEVKGEERKQTIGRAKNLESVSLNLRNGRRLYVDLRENEQGKFINMAVVSGRGPVPRIAMPLEVAKQFLDFLGQIGPKLKTTQTAAANTNEKADEKGAQQGGRSRGPAIHSATLTAGKDREYELSLLPSLFEGREPVLQVVSTLNKSGRRTMNIESGEVPQLKKALNRVLRRADGQAGDDGDGEKSEKEGDKEPAKRVTPNRQTIVFGNKRFHFDPFDSARGQYIKISNVYFRGPQVRKDSIVVPAEVLDSFAKILSDYDAEMNSSDSKGEDSNSSAPSVSSSSDASSTQGMKKDA